MLAKFNKYFFITIVVIALIPAIPGVLIMLGPIGILCFVLFGFAWFPRFRRGVFGTVGGIGSGIGAIVTGIFGGFFKIIGWTFKGLFTSIGWLFGLGGSSARFMSIWEKASILSSRNKGILMDGRSARLSEKDSYQSLLIQGGMGRGKTSVIVMPNLLMPPADEPSFVISDTSGEIYQKTSGYLHDRGYRIRALNLIDPKKSETYNPLAGALAPQQIADVAKTLIASSHSQSGGKASDPFWEQAAEKLIRILAQCLINQGNPRYCNLANLRHLVTSFDAHVAGPGKLGKIDQFVLANTQNDPLTFASYQAFVQGNFKAIQSVLMTADVALDGVATPEIASLTQSNSLDLNELRTRKTALYIIVNQTDMELYAFLLNLFYAELFKSLLKDARNPGNPVWLFLDEFGHLSINGFEVFATTSRKYKVAFALFLQSMAQLENKYGRSKAKIIQEALGSEIYFPGMALDTAKELEARLGSINRTPLRAANELIRMKDNQALLLNSNRPPVVLKTKPYFKRGDLNRRSKLPQAILPTGHGGMPPLLPL